jgi:ubiquitin C-terminal hydrolase
VHTSCEVLDNFPMSGQTLHNFRNPITAQISSARRRYASIGTSPQGGHPAASSAITLEQCLREHTQEELLDESNAWYCNTCRTHQRAKKIVKFWGPRLPQVLILVLKRFEFRDIGNIFASSANTHMIHREKIDSLVDFPVNGLDMTAFCCGNSVGSNAPNDKLYDLFAVCNHFGRLGSGHYTAMARDWRGSQLSDTWVRFRVMI